MKTKKILLCTVALTLGACSSYGGTTPTETPMLRNTETYSMEYSPFEDLYRDYEFRDPCLNTRSPHRSYTVTCVRDVADLPPEPVTTYIMQPAQENVVIVPTPTYAAEGILPIVNSYTVLFDFDKSNIRADESQTLEQVVSGITTYNPTQVTVTGYTDSSGDMEYNQILSEQREQAVSKALLERGIENQILDRQARGETEQAVKTLDGVKNQDNRRVVIDFRR